MNVARHRERRQDVGAPRASPADADRVDPASLRTRRARARLVGGGRRRSKTFRNALGRASSGRRGARARARPKSGGRGFARLEPLLQPMAARRWRPLAESRTPSTPTPASTSSPSQRSWRESASRSPFRRAAPIPRRPFWAQLQNMTNATGDAASEVVRRVSAARRPVILAGSPVARWPALARWTPARLALELPELPVVDESATSTFWWYDEGRQLKLPPRRTHPLRTNVTPAAFFLQKSDAYRQFHAKLHSPALVRLAAAADPREFLQNADRRPGLPPVDGAETFWAGDDGTTSHTHYDGDGNFRADARAQALHAVAARVLARDGAAPIPARGAPPVAARLRRGGRRRGGQRAARLRRRRRARPVERMLRRAARFAGLEAAGAALGARALLRSRRRRARRSRRCSLPASCCTCRRFGSTASPPSASRRPSRSSPARPTAAASRRRVGRGCPTRSSARATPTTAPPPRAATRAR